MRARVCAFVGGARSGLVNARRGMNYILRNTISKSIYRKI